MQKKTYQTFSGYVSFFNSFFHILDAFLMSMCLASFLFRHIESTFRKRENFETIDIEDGFHTYPI